MFVIIGYAVALGCIFGAYVLHGGNVGVIVAALPTEMMDIAGGALGAFVVCNQPPGGGAFDLALRARLDANAERHIVSRSGTGG